MWPLPIKDLLFVGKSSASLLESLNIHTIGELAKANPDLLKKHFKNMTDDLIKRANGIDNSKVITDYGFNKCISISRTLEKDTSDIKKLKRILLDMSNQVGLRARKYNLFAKNVAITFKTSSFRSFSHSMTLNNPINNTLDIYNNVLLLFEKTKLTEKVRSIGVRIGDLDVKNNEQVSLFTSQNDDSVQKLLDNINAKYKNTVVMPAIFYEKDKPNN